MKETKADLILHPVRMRIIQTILAGKKMTVQHIAETLTEVPQATLYRHLNKLTKAGIIEVVEQNPIRGTVEKVYSLSLQNASVTQSDLQHASRDDHLRYFMTFAASLIDDFSQYLNRDEIDLQKDGVGYRQASFYVTEEEFTELTQTIGAAIRLAMENKPAPDRVYRTLSTIFIPK